MGVVWRLSLLITVASCRTIGEENVLDYDRLITVCTDDRMEIHLKKNFDQFHLKGDAPECKGAFGTFIGYDGVPYKVKTWSLPLKEGADGPCGLQFVPMPDSQLWTHETTIYGLDKNRTAQCIKTGMLDKRGAQIRIEQLTPTLQPIKARSGSTVEVKGRSTISAYFHHRFPQAAGLSLHPYQCWLINERRQTRRLVVDNGCPLMNKAGTKPIVVMGSESASAATGDHPHIFFNAEKELFEDENPADLPSFRLQCTVMPCKGMNLYQQVIGVARCPSIAWCQDNKRQLKYKPNDLFEVNQDFSLAISSSSSLEPRLYRPMSESIYPGQYWFIDSKKRAEFRKREAEEEEEGDDIKMLCIGLLGAFIAAIFITGVMLFRRRKAVAAHIRQQIRRFSSRKSESMTQEKISTTPLVAEESILIN